MTGRVLASERVVLGATAITLSLALTSWVLMRFGAYTLGRAAGLSLLPVAALELGVRRWRSRSPLPAGREPWHWLALAGALCVAFGLLYAAYPTYFLLGGQDPGPYLAFGARIANTGGLDLRVPEIQRWAAHQPPGTFRPFPAVYGDMGSADPNELHPQFVHLYTAYMANYFAAFGVEGAVRANAWLAVLCLATGFAFVRRLGSLAAAFVFVVAFGISPAFVWASRITLTEVVALWLNLSGLLLLLLAWECESLALGWLAASVLGFGVLNRLDGGLATFALLGFSAAATLETGARRRAASLAALVHFVVILFGYFDGERLAPAYFHDLNRISGGTVTKLIVLTLGLDLVAIALPLMPARWKPALRVNETTLRLAGYATVVFLTVWVAYGFTLRPFGTDPETANTFFELTWYLGFVAWPLCMVGLFAGLGPRRFQQTLPLLIFTAGSLYIYTSRTDVAHVHIWASRRWVPHVIPFVFMGAALGLPRVLAGLRWLTRSRGPAWSRVVTAGGALLLGVAWLLPLINFTRVFLLHSMLDGLPKSYARVAEYARKHPEQFPLLTGTVQVGSILTYVYGVPTVVVAGRGIERVDKTDAFVGQMGVCFDPFDLRNDIELEARFTGKYLEYSSDEPPDQLIELRVPLEVGTFHPHARFDFEIPASHPSFRTRETARQPDGSLVVKKGRGPVLWGPGIDLDAGRYRIEWYGNAKPSSRRHRGTLDVIDDVHADALAEMPLEASDDPGERLLGGLDFTLDKPTHGLDFRVRVDPKSGVRLSRLRFQRFGP